MLFPLLENGPSLEHFYSNFVFKRFIPILVKRDYIVVLSSDGEIKRKISLYGILKDKIPSSIFGFAQSRLMSLVYKFLMNLDLDEAYDMLHTNTIEIIRNDIPGLCRKGDLLISSRSINLIAILDPHKEELVWSWGQGELEGQHHPTLLENGNILVFDNGYKVERGYSRVIELNPITKEIVWEYKADSPGEFYTAVGGSSQRLPNGNTLIAETEKGRSFEVTQKGEIVWDFYNPDVKREGLRRGIYRMTRITDPDHHPVMGR